MDVFEEMFASKSGILQQKSQLGRFSCFTNLITAISQFYKNCICFQCNSLTNNFLLSLSF